MSGDRENALASLYPFLYGARKDEPTENAALLHSVAEKAAHSIEVKRAFFESNADRVVATARAIAEVYRRQGRMFAMGNGGSSCDAAHFAVEFLHPITAGRPALSATNLTADVAMISAVGNDVGFAHVFVRQLTSLARHGDGLIGFSTSRNSANLIAAFIKARELGMTTIGIAGMAGGEMAQAGLLDHCLVVETDSIHRIQETHVTLYHILWDLVHTMLADDRGALAGPARAGARP
jgi:D-sedoheptulose 7-phosphate isomerase